MSLTTYFRALLCIFVGLVFAEIAADLTTTSWLPDPLREYVEAQMKDDTISSGLMMLALFATLAMGLMLVSVAGLWLLWRPARMLYTLFLLSLACAVAASGTVVQSALTSVLGFMNTIIAGAILAMIYFSPLREHFDAPSPEEPPGA
jgi:hypothetical protein